MVCCCVPFCPSKKGQTRNVSFHEFPSDNTLRQLWLKMISREGETPGTPWIPTQRSVVCSRHFLPTNYSTRSSRKVLLPGVHPTVFEDFPEHLQRKVHFEPSQFERCIPGKLKPNAIPTIFSSFRQPRVGKRTSVTRISTSKKCPPPPRKKILLDHLNFDRIGDSHLGTASPGEGKKCSVEGCRNSLSTRNYHKSRKLVFFPFPKDISIIGRWITFCGKPATWNVLENCQICSDHFCPKDYEDDGLAVLKKHAVPSKMAIPLVIRDSNVVIRAEERNICRQENRKTAKKSPEQSRENPKEPSVNNSQELRAEDIHLGLPSVEDSSSSADVKTGDFTRDLKYNIECIVLNPPIDSNRTSVFETLDEIYILKKMLDDGDMLLKSDHLKQMEEANRRCAILENELAKSRKQLEDFKNQGKTLVLENKNVNNQCERCKALKECVRKEKLKVQEVTKKLTEKNKTLENDFKPSQCSRTSPTIIRESPECLLKRVFTENQVNVLLRKKNVIIWTKKEMNYFLRLSHQISKSAYAFLVSDMKLPFPGTQELEAFSGICYPGQPIFFRTNENKLPATNTVKCVVPSSSATISTIPILINRFTDLVSPMCTSGDVNMKSVVPSKNVNATVPVHTDISTINIPINGTSDSASPMSTTTSDIVMTDVHTGAENIIPTGCDSLITEDPLFYLITASEILN